MRAKGIGGRGEKRGEEREREREKRGRSRRCRMQGRLLVATPLSFYLRAQLANIIP